MRVSFKTLNQQSIHHCNILPRGFFLTGFVLQNSLNAGTYLSRQRVSGIVRTILVILALLASAPGQSRRPDSASDSAELVRAAELLRTGKPDEAEPLLRRILAANPKNADAHNLLGVLLDKRGNSAQAEREYRTALSINPRSISARANLGVLQARTGHGESAIATLESVLRDAPNHAQATLNLGLVYAARGDYRRALPFLEKARAQQPENLTVLAELGFTLYELKRTDEATEVLASAASFAPNDPNILYLSGLVASLRGDPEGAATFWQKALVLRPEFPAANFMIGEELRKQRRYGGAVEFYQNALNQDPTQLVFHVRLAGTYILLSQCDRALEIFERATKRFPNSAELQYFVGIAARGVGNFELAETALRKSLAMQDGNVNALAQLGFVLDQRGLDDEAEKLLRRAVATEPRHFYANFDLGRVLVHTKQYEQAITPLMTAEQIRPHDIGAHYQLFIVFSHLKRKEDADRELKLFRQYEAESKIADGDEEEVEDKLPRPPNREQPD